MRIIYALIGLVIGVMPCGAVVSDVRFERDDAFGVALRLAGTGGEHILRGIEAPSGIWNFTTIALFAGVDPFLAETAVMSFSVGLENRIVGGGEFGTHPFDDFIPFSEPLIVREGFSFRLPDEFVPWTSGNFFAIDSRPEPLDPGTWGWTAFFSLVAPERVPDAGSTLGMLVIALGGLGFMRKR